MREKLVNAAVTVVIGVVPALLVYCQGKHETDVKYEIAKYQATVSYDTLAKAVRELQVEVTRLQLKGSDLAHVGAGSASTPEPQPDAMRMTFPPLPSNLDQAVARQPALQALEP
jgi:hypothetical protein